MYRSLDAGLSWQAMGLAASQHSGRILVDPRDSSVVLVAAEGPLWSAGGERGVYRSSDGGATRRTSGGVTVGDFWAADRNPASGNQATTARLGGR